MKKNLWCLVPCLFANIICAAPATGILNFEIPTSTPIVRMPDELLNALKESQALFEYFLDEVELDESLTLEEQLVKVKEYKQIAKNLSPDTASFLIYSLNFETKNRIHEMLKNALLDEQEIAVYLGDFEEVISRPQNRNVEFAREMLFFVAELKIHRQYIYEFGVALGCPEKQLLRHDLCKLSAGQFEGYARFYRGGRLEKDRAACLKAWGEHQHEEHHLESYTKEGFNIDAMSDERLRNNMLEVVADNLAATKQRGGGPLTDRLVHIHKSDVHPRLVPFLEEGFIRAHTLYLEAEANPEVDSIFKGMPCWNDKAAEAFSKLR